MRDEAGALLPSIVAREKRCRQDGASEDELPRE